MYTLVVCIATYVVHKRTVQYSCKCMCIMQHGIVLLLPSISTVYAFHNIIYYDITMSVKMDVRYYVLKVIFLTNVIILIHLKMQSLGYVKCTLIVDDVNSSFIMFSMPSIIWFNLYCYLTGIMS